VNLATLNTNIDPESSSGLNPEQFLSPHEQNSKKRLEHLNFNIGICLELSALNLKFNNVGL